MCVDSGATELEDLCSKELTNFGDVLTDGLQDAVASFSEPRRDVSRSHDMPLS